MKFFDKRHLDGEGEEARLSALRQDPKKYGSLLQETSYAVYKVFEDRGLERDGDLQLQVIGALVAIIVEGAGTNSIALALSHVAKFAQHSFAQRRRN